MKKTAVITAIGLLWACIIPAGAFAIQSGGGYIIYDQINNSPSVVLGSGANSQSGGSPVSSQAMVGGGFSSFGGAYRGSVFSTTTAPLPPLSPALSGGGSVAFIPPSINASGFSVQFPLAGVTPNPLIPGIPQTGTSPATQGQNTFFGQTNQPVALATQPPALFDVTALPGNIAGSNFSGALMIFINTLLGALIGILGLSVTRRMYDNSKIPAAQFKPNDKDT